jgi:parvulin-like peptidyl-prolyl isomerase
VGPIAEPAGPASPLAGAQLFEPTRTVAIVGDRHILYGEIGPTVEQILAPLAAQITSDYERKELEKVREQLTRQYLRQYVDTKLMYLEFERQLEKNAGRDKLVEARTGIERKMRESFEKDLLAMREKVAGAKAERIQELMRRDPTLPRLAMLMKQHQCETMQELDTVLRQYGSSLDKQIRFYGENILGRSTLGRQITTNPEVTHEEMLDYYAANADEFAVPAKAKFELLTVKFANHPTRNEAWNKLAQMGNEVYFGAPFATIAKKHSEEPRAAEGGAYDWTTKGSLASKVIDQAIFTLEPGKLSQILEDERGVHIVRVLEREEEHQVAFLDAQPSIKEAIVLKKREEDFKKALESQRTGVAIWTIYDEQPELARQPYQPGGTVPR